MENQRATSASGLNKDAVTGHDEPSVQICNSKSNSYKDGIKG